MLAAHTLPVGDLPLSALRLMNDARFPWAILVPKRAGVVEFHALSREDRIRLCDETAIVSEALSKLAAAHKMNVAALGNQVRQLHIHVIARKEDDAAWPQPVWGRGERAPYAAGEGEAFAVVLANAIALCRN
jgi:diadenosine tetraphosphate (Ap4A) HIT family hydrolase